MTLAIAHRGASAYEPENTLAAFHAAVEFESDGIELDVHGSADGAIVVHHDPTVAGLTIGDVAYNRVARAVEALGVTAPPTLPDVLEAIGPNTIVYIEVKSLKPELDEALFDAIAAAPSPDNCQIHSFDHRIVRRLVDARPGLIGGALSASYPIDAVKPVRDAGARTLWQQGTLIDEALVDRIHEENLTIIAWTVDDPDQMRWLEQIGVDGVCSNMPDVARRVLR